MNSKIDYEPAKVILSQLGNFNRMRAMVAIHNVILHSRESTLIEEPRDAVSFKFKGSRVNFCKISLNPSDLYDLEFGKITKKGLEYKVVKTVENVYNDQLKTIFEEFTGLYLSL